MFERTAPERKERNSKQLVHEIPFISPDDPLAQEKEAACLDLLIREFFHFVGPQDAPALPTCMEREEIPSNDPEAYISRQYRDTIRECLIGFRYGQGFTLPSYPAFARHIMAAECTPEFVRKDPVMLAKYPPARIPDFQTYLEECGCEFNLSVREGGRA